MKKGKLIRFETSLTWDGKDYDAVSIIRTRIDMPHLSLDAGNRRWLARPAMVVDYSLFDYMGEDCTGDVWMKKDQEAVAAIILSHYRDDQYGKVADGVYEEVVGCA